MKSLQESDFNPDFVFDETNTPLLIETIIKEDPIDRAISRKRTQLTSLGEILDSVPSIPFEEESYEMVKDSSGTEITTFNELGLSRPLMKALTSMGFVSPTPIQTAAIPVALSGRDICGGSSTGSGKTAAFMVPVIERLLYRSRNGSASRVLVLLPTRELASQCFDVTKKLIQFTDIQSCLVAGGFPVKPQEIDLKKRPDIIIATPGRLVDHLNNLISFSLEKIEILVLDEADRMLEVGFEQELKFIIQSCPKNRQTMLFSATLSSDVEKIATVSLKKPVRIEVDANEALTRNLTQEFIRVRQNHEMDRPAMILGKKPSRTNPNHNFIYTMAAYYLALASRLFSKRCIIFFPSKDLTHRMKIVFGLLSLKASELHGNLTQQQRIDALEKFRLQQVDFLLATDLAARGLDIPGVETVINYSLPSDYRKYLHRVGRTARAGSAGRSVSLVGEEDRKVLKLAIKNSHHSVKQRTLGSDIIIHFHNAVEGLSSTIEEILAEEKEEKKALIIF